VSLDFIWADDGELAVEGNSVGFRKDEKYGNYDTMNTMRRIEGGEVNHREHRGHREAKKFLKGFVFEVGGVKVNRNAREYQR
jgi:hypothetical protein